MATQDDTELELTITRVFDAPRELVFAAWTDPAQMAAWYGPEGFTARGIEIDPVPGGSWAGCMREDATGVDSWSRGTYVEVSPPERLVFTFAWDMPPDGRPGTQTLITIDFQDLGGSTRMTFHQAGFTSAAARDGHEGGWTSAFDGLAAQVKGRRN